MQTPPLLSLIIFLPLIGAFFILLIKGEETMVSRNARAVALLTSIGTLFLSFILIFYFNFNKADFQLVENIPWIDSFNINYTVGIDGISLLFVWLTAFLMPIVILSSFGSVSKRVKEYMVAFLVLETMMMGTFCALDFVLFYLFFEGVLIPMFLIIGIWGGENRIYSAFKFFLYTFAGSIFMLVAIFVIYAQLGSMSVEAAFHHTFPFGVQMWLWLAFFSSFAVKLPMWPVHTWLPYAHVEAPTAGSVLLAAILLKMGGYGFLRFSLPLFPEACVFFAPYVYGLSIIAVIYTSLVALVQTDMKKLIAYSSIAHMGFVTFGIFVFSQKGLEGALFQMLSHGVLSAALFLSVGVLYDRLHTRQIDQFGGVIHKMPVFAVLLMVFILGTMGLPGTTGFIGEFLVLVSSFRVNGLLTFGLGTGMILSACYALWLYRRLMLGKIANDNVKKMTDLTLIEKCSLVPLFVVSLLFGLWPHPILKISEPSIKKIARYYTKYNHDSSSKKSLKEEMDNTWN
jgi:NADH-quinone oxidoreductase subunit M